MFTTEQLRIFLEACEIGAPLQLFDKRYELLNKSWLLKEFSINYGYYLRQYNVYYIPECFDCEDFSRSAAHFISLYCLRLKKIGAPAFGELFYWRDDNTAHAINAAVCEGPELVFYDPQYQKQVFLSDNERQRIVSCRF